MRACRCVRQLRMPLYHRKFENLKIPTASFGRCTRLFGTLGHEPLHLRHLNITMSKGRFALGNQMELRNLGRILISGPLDISVGIPEAVPPCRVHVAIPTSNPNKTKHCPKEDGRNMLCVCEHLLKCASKTGDPQMADVPLASLQINQTQNPRKPQSPNAPQSPAPRLPDAPGKAQPI